MITKYCKTFKIYITSVSAVLVLVKKISSNKMVQRKKQQIPTMNNPMKKVTNINNYLIIDSYKSLGGKVSFFYEI